MLIVVLSDAVKLSPTYPIAKSTIPAIKKRNLLDFLVGSGSVWRVLCSGGPGSD